MFDEIVKAIFKALQHEDLDNDLIISQKSTETTSLDGNNAVLYEITIDELWFYNTTMIFEDSTDPEKEIFTTVSEWFGSDLKSIERKYDEQYEIELQDVLEKTEGQYTLQFLIEDIMIYGIEDTDYFYDRLRDEGY